MSKKKFKQEETISPATAASTPKQERQPDKGNDERVAEATRGGELFTKPTDIFGKPVKPGLFYDAKNQQRIIP